MSKKHTEIRFEEAIEEFLVSTKQYEKGDPKDYDVETALFPQDVFAFLEKSQSKYLDAVKEYYGKEAEGNLLSALSKELNTKGSLYVLRHGFKFFGKTFKLAYFKPNTNLNPDAWKDYEKNVLKIYRQVHFSKKNPNLSIDVILALNGVPVCTMELKNPLSGQNVENAKTQYKKDRDPRELLFQFKKRALVHFAVDTEEVFMTTKLAEDSTYFLPFNRGFDEGAGNPPIEDNYRTAYLWEDVLTKDGLLDLVGRYLHLELTEKKVYTDKGVFKEKKETLIFPRFHQLDVVRKLIQNSKEKGSGHNYLIQHSAGSGKSNSIAWLSYRLASLHDENDEKIFNSVIVITDRRVLDQQLQDTIYQFEHKKGVVAKIEKDTKQLVEALSEGVPIIISTIQKFPFITEALEKLSKDGKNIELDTKGKQFAVIVDEAHSSQSGEAASELKRVLNKDGIEAIVAEQILDIEEEELTEDAKKELIREMSKRRKQPNISFYAFTATPKFKTQLFFDEPGEDGEAPFHLYSMRQAIEEGFILDVLENYTTYKTYVKLIKTIQDDPEVPRRKAAKALARFINFHPHNLRQKVELIVEHFRNYTKKKIGGRAKAIIVTNSRLHAVRYKQEVDKYLKEKKYIDIKSLVAFSGTVTDPDAPNISYTETGMNNGIREKELPDKFETYEYQVLIVAEKYQTGFDQPLLHTMYVDKRLFGVQAVQTLSRLNRTAPGKMDTFVLDFVNDREDIYKSFKPYYEKTLFDKPTDPQLLSSLAHTIYEWKLFFSDEVDKFCNIWFSTSPDKRTKEHKLLNAYLDNAVDKYAEMTEEEKQTIKKQLNEFKNLYSFLSQVLPYGDSEFEKLYVFIRNLLKKLPKRTSSNVDIDEDVELKYYRLQKIAEGAIKLKTGENPQQYGPKEVGTGSVEDEISLSELIEVLNQRFGTEFTAADQLFFEQIRESAIKNEELVNAAIANNLENFRYVFDKQMINLFVDRLDGNEDIFTKLMNDDEFKEVASFYLSKSIYEDIKRQISE
jgi:type I restriction enzyme R subunit